MAHHKVDLDNPEWMTKLSADVYDTDDNVLLSFFNKKDGGGPMVGYPKADMIKFCRELLAILE